MINDYSGSKQSMWFFSKLWYVCLMQLQVIKDSMEIFLRHKDIITLCQIENPLFGKAMKTSYKSHRSS